jgi:hypothetical protein
MCQFGVTEVGFLGFIINSDGISMESDRIATIEAWLTPTSIRDLQVLLEVANFYLWFIRTYAKLTQHLTELLKVTTDTTLTPKAAGMAVGKPNKPHPKCECTWEAELLFRKLKRAFIEALMLPHFDAAKPIILQTDASSFAIPGFLNQYDGFGTLRPVNFDSQKCIPAKQNYNTYDRELLAIVDTMKQWPHFLQ